MLIFWCFYEQLLLTKLWEFVYMITSPCYKSNSASNNASEHKWNISRSQTASTSHTKCKYNFHQSVIWRQRWTKCAQRFSLKEKIYHVRRIIILSTFIRENRLIQKMDSISYFYISWTVHGMWMIYITFERGGPKFSNTTARALAYSSVAASVESKMATIQHKIFYVREFIKTDSATAVQRAFRLHYNIQHPTRKSICLWNHQFEQTDCLCKGNSSGRPRVSEENVRRIQESFERSPRKSTRRAIRELGIPQTSGMCWGAIKP